MDIPGSEVYQRLLEQEASSVSFAEMDDIIRLFEAKAELLQNAAMVSEPNALPNAMRVRKLLEHPDKLTDRQLLIALGALRYFVRDEDHSDDTHGDSGVEDDAFVLEAAIQELEEPLNAGW